MQTGTVHCVTRKALEDMAIVTNRGTSPVSTTNNCRRMSTKCSYTHVNNINMTMTDFFFFVRLSDSKHRLLSLYRVSQEEGTKLWESVPYVKIYQYNLKYLYPKLNGYGDNGQRSLKL